MIVAASHAPAIQIVISHEIIEANRDGFCRFSVHQNQGENKFIPVKGSNFRLTGFSLASL